MATTHTRYPLKYSSGSYNIHKFKEGASQSFVAGAFVKLGTNSQVEISATDDTVVLGMALGDATGTTNADCLVLVPNDDTVFEMSTDATTNEALVATDRCLKTGLLVVSGLPYLDLDEQTAEMFIIVGLADVDGVATAIGDSAGRVFVHILPTAMQMGGAAESA